MPTTDRLFWIDVETFGLEPQTGPIIEIALAVTEQEPPFEMLDRITLVLWSDAHEDEYQYHKKVGLGELEGDDFIWKMHTKNGLFDDARRNGLGEHEATDRLLGFLIRNQVDDQPPLCGSSLRLDRNFIDVYFPDVAAYFGYRSIDVSTVKELINRYLPEVARERDLVWDKSKAKHRALDDIVDSIDEYSLYHGYLFGEESCT